MDPYHDDRFATLKRWTAAVLFVAIAAIIVIRVSVTRKEPARPGLVVPQTAGHIESDALTVAQTALDRSLRTLVGNPAWRDGFNEVSLDRGSYDVTVYDASDDGDGVYDPSVPPNLVRIIVTSRVDGDVKIVEAIWSDPMTAYGHVISAGNEISIGEPGGAGTTIVGDIHNNAYDDGKTDFDGANSVYGRTTSAGDISIGTSHTTGPMVVYGSVRGSGISIETFGEIKDFEDLSEWSEGIDLNHDGDLDDMYVSKTTATVGAAIGIVCDGHELVNTETDIRIADGTQPVDVGASKPGTIVDPRPNFRAYYEMVTGLSMYPPPAPHFFYAIPGDGNGNYFASASVFLNWINTQQQIDVMCWRCAGDAQIGPDNDMSCPSCGGTGETPAVVIAGVFYVDDPELDLGNIQNNLIIHGSLVIAHGDPYRWPAKTVRIPSGETSIEGVPGKGSLVIGGPTRMHLTITPRSDQNGGTYSWRHRYVRSGTDRQMIAILEPEPTHAMTGFPAVIAASAIDIQPRGTGFAHHAGDIGDEAVTVIRGLLYAENSVRIDGRGGHRGDPFLFDEEQSRAETDVFDETLLRIDLNDDGDMFDFIKTIDITNRPVIRVSKGRFNIDINNDGVFGMVVLGEDYGEFFNQRGYALPALYYHEGSTFGQVVHIAGQCVATYDPSILDAGVPFGFEISPEPDAQRGLLSWREISLRK